MGSAGIGRRNILASRSYCLNFWLGMMKGLPVFRLTMICWLFFLLTGTSGMV